MILLGIVVVLVVLVVVKYVCGYLSDKGLFNAYRY